MNTMTDLRTGDVLPNGAMVLAYTRQREGGDGVLAGGVVLAFRGHDYQPDPYVTWDVAFQDGCPSTFSGHYFADISTAALDYASRGGR